MQTTEELRKLSNLDTASELALARNMGKVRVTILDKYGERTDGVLAYVLWEVGSDSIELQVQSEDDNLAMQEMEENDAE